MTTAFAEENKGARVGLTPVQGDGAVGAADLLPVGDLSPEDLSDLIHGQRLKGILGVDDHRKTVHGKGDSDGIDAVGLGLGDFRVLHGPGGIARSVVLLMMAAIPTPEPPPVTAMLVLASFFI